jgi:predicted site-specific integrase-resolvase
VSIKHLNQFELAERWGISEPTLERWRCEGIGPVFLKLRSRVVYREEDICIFEQASLRRSTSASHEAGIPS